MMKSSHTTQKPWCSQAARRQSMMKMRQLLRTVFFDWVDAEGHALLGICYGMQLIVHAKGGKVSQGSVKEYGRTPIDYKGQRINVWMSHGDEIEELPKGFKLVAKSDAGVPAAIEHESKPISALQFHPEVTHSEHGTEILKAFVDRSGIDTNWDMGSVITEQLKKITETVGKDEHVICALSGGVDSTVAATLVHQALGDRLHCVFVDHGLNRFEEGARVMKMFDEHLHLPVTKVDAADQFLGHLKGVTDPEKKRKIIGKKFI
ncbi:MAG TPA: hypothetical protein EYN66_24680, partial [Myxococcales bacterium]|nr:hypothetical protein [Myxococcales bacterium]